MLGNGPLYPDKECEHLLHKLYPMGKKAWDIQKAALASGQQLFAEINDEQHGDVGNIPATMKCCQQ
jgi:hypothetical protein